MAESAARAEMRRAIVAAAEVDPRIVGLLDYGSGGEGSVDEWSDLDLEVFIRDGDLPAFEQDWKSWAAQFGRSLLAYRGWVGHPWLVYDTEPVPLRVDLDLHPESAIEGAERWLSYPVSVEAMLLYDGTDGRLRRVVELIAGRSRRPDDERAAFERVAGDFWYYLLYVHAKQRRGAHLTARAVFGSEVFAHLLNLLRLEGKATQRWRYSAAGTDLDGALTPVRRSALDRCVPGPAVSEIERAMREAATLGREVCTTISSRGGWPWTEELADRTITLLAGE